MISLAVLATGVLGVVDLAGASIWASAYLAVPLAVVGLGLLIASVAGRGRWLIVVGATLLVALGIVTAVERADGGSATWEPTSLSELRRSYRVGVGDATLDLTGITDWGRAVVDVRIDVGDLTVILPPFVDADVSARSDVGSVNLFGIRSDGIGRSTRRITNYGADGPGGGELRLSANVDIGDITVLRRG